MNKENSSDDSTKASPGSSLTDHLRAELDKVEKMSTQERLAYLKKSRAELKMLKSSILAETNFWEKLRYLDREGTHVDDRPCFNFLPSSSLTHNPHYRTCKNRLL